MPSQLAIRRASFSSNALLLVQGTPWLVLLKRFI